MLTIYFQDEGRRFKVLFFLHFFSCLLLNAIPLTNPVLLDLLERVIRLSSPAVWVISILSLDKRRT